MTTIVGVDFSGGWADDKTWIAQGSLDNEGKFVLNNGHPAYSIRRHELFRLLADIQAPAVVALDFPFGVPNKFAKYIGVDVMTERMPTVWQVVAGMNAEQFLEARHCFVNQYGEVKRAGDLRFHSESFSPLHLVQPIMLGMTYAGIYLLSRWHESNPNRWYVPPLLKPTGHDGAVTLLETMPGAILKSLAIDYDGYKGGNEWANRRTVILDTLSSASGVSFDIPDDIRALCLRKSKDDCLDAIIAAVGAAMWQMDKEQTLFHRPEDHQDDPTVLMNAQLEGWIYVPRRKPVKDAHSS